MSARRRKQPAPRRMPADDGRYAFMEEKKILNEWIDKRLSIGQVPRLSDVKDYARFAKINIPIKAISTMYRLHRAFVLSTRQQRDPKRSRKQPPIITNVLGVLHGDIGYFPLSSEYNTPKQFQHGFILFKDVLSRYTYVELLKTGKSAPSLVRAMKKVLLHHKRAHPDYNIWSISFDKEQGMKSRLMKNFMKDEHILLYYYGNTSSKAKIAENAIRLLRTDIQVGRNFNDKELWWQVIKQKVEALNMKEIKIEDRSTGYRPIDINATNVDKFIKKCQSILPSLHHGQFRVDPSLLSFKFRPGDKVRPKLLLSSSQVIGNKRSQISLDPKLLFEIKEYAPFITRDLHLRPGYRCIEVNYGDLETFAEEDIALVELAGQTNVDEGV